MPTGGRRSKPSPRFFSVGDTRVQPSHWRGAAPSAQGSRSRAMPVGDRRSAVARHHVRRRYATSRPCGPRCRPEVGAPSRPRASSQSAVRNLVAQRRRRRFRAPARCRSETGAPLSRALHAGRRYVVSAVARHHADRRYAVSRPCGPWCRPEVGAPSRPRDSSRSAIRGSAALTLAWRSVVDAGFALLRDAGLKTGAPTGAPYPPNSFFAAAMKRGHWGVSGLFGGSQTFSTSCQASASETPLRSVR